MVAMKAMPATKAMKNVRATKAMKATTAMKAVRAKPVVKVVKTNKKAAKTMKVMKAKKTLSNQVMNGVQLHMTYIKVHLVSVNELPGCVYEYMSNLAQELVVGILHTSHPYSPQPTRV